MKNTIPFVAACVVLLPYCFGHIRWHVNNTNPVEFGENVTLHCHANNRCLNNRKWTMGHTLLALNGQSAYKRYTMIIHSSIFDLIIGNFREDDIGKNYTCVCGMCSYTKQLMQGEINLLSIPRNETIIDSSSIVNGILLLNITLMAVYPAPECNITFSSNYKYRLPCDSRMVNVVTEKTYGGYYQANLAYKYKLPTCTGNITAICTVWKYTTSVYKRYFENCTVPLSKPQKRQSNNIYFIIPLFVFALVVLLAFAKTCVQSHGDLDIKQTNTTA